MLSVYQKDVRNQKGLQASVGDTQSREQSNVGQNLTIGFLIMKVRLLHGQVEKGVILWIEIYPATVYM